MPVETAASPVAPPVAAAQTPPAPLPAGNPSTPPHGSSDPPAAAATSELSPSRDALQPEYRATSEDFILWGVIAAMLGYFAWHLKSVTAVFAKTEDIERLAVYGMNERADLMLLIGAALSLLGCMIVLRRVRTNFSAGAAKEGMQARLVADSAGVVIVVLGVILLAFIVIHPPRFERGRALSDSSSSSAGEKATTLQDALEQARRLQAQDQPDSGKGGKK